MVSTIDPPQAFAHPRVDQQPLHFPFAPQPSQSKPLYPKSSSKPAYYHNAARSPSLSDVTISDNETTTSSHDEFYLEKYSSRIDSAYDTKQGKERTSKRAKKARPELNILTHLPGSQARVCDPDVTVEQVGAKRTAATIRPKSVVSAKAEHFDSSLIVERTRAFATIKNLAQARRERKQASKGAFEKLEDAPEPAPEHHATSRKQMAGESGESKAVVIGLSIPESEAAAHQSQANLSAVTLDTPTPTTPAIVITPADIERPQDSQRLLKPDPPTRGPRPSSSVYSNLTFFKNRNAGSGDVPPLPRIPQIPNQGGRRRSFEGADSQPPLEQETRKSRRFSTGSREEIPPSEFETSRHKSQGWWNLSLSPMLSRAGTSKNQRDRGNHSPPDVPPIPETAFKGRARSGTDGSQISPETPRRLGLAGIRASIWSHWTTEHKDTRAVRDSVNTTFPEHGDNDRDDELSVLDAQEPLPRELPFQDSMALLQPRVVGGLADEYYHACAIEQLTRQPYFECVNHSCAAQWPHFCSVYDKDDEGRDGVSELPITQSTQDERGGSNAVALGAAGAVGAATGAAITAAAMHQRTASEASEPAVVSPNVRQADTGSVVQARAVENKTPPIGQADPIHDQVEHSRSLGPDTSGTAPLAAAAPLSAPGNDAPVAAETQPSPGQQTVTRYPNLAAIVPPPASTTYANNKVVSPGPVSPEMQHIMASRGAVPMADLRFQNHTASYPPPVVNNYYGYAQAEEPKAAEAALIKPSPQVKQAMMTSDKEESPEKATKPGLIQRIKLWAAKRKATKATRSADKKSKRKHRCIAALIFVSLLMMIAGSILLALLLTRRGDRTPTQTQWLNLTGYPPMPTGISTIIRPDAVVQQSQCVEPATAWSCSLPPEDHFEVAPNDPDQPNFRFEIRFRNGTVSSNLTIPVDESGSRRKRASDPFTNALFDPSPAPPPRAEQVFLGNTTDNTTEPFDGEETPFYISFLPAFPIDPSDISLNTTENLDNATSRLKTRQQSTDDDLADLVPPPSIDGSGLAAAANLLPISPFPTSQPIRFYNRGLPDEHYGFYMYYDRSIFLTTGVSTNTNGSTENSTIVTPNSADSSAGNSSDSDGGSARSDARSRCTFSQTRFLVQIFTNPAFDGTLTGPVPEVGSKEAGNSATNYTPPGSFPYPTTITIDRHGGNVNKKAAYCYGVDAQQKIQTDVKGFRLEFRGEGGSIINPAPDIFLSQEAGDGEEFSQEAGGIDGGTGGCKCAWQNWS